MGRWVGGGGGGEGRVGYGDVALGAPHGEGGVRDVPGAGEEGEGWGGEGRGRGGGGDRGGGEEGGGADEGGGGGHLRWMEDGGRRSGG